MHEEKRGRPKRWTPEQVDEVEALYKTGMPVARIADQFGVGYDAMAGVVKRYGLSRDVEFAEWFTAEWNRVTEIVRNSLKQCC